MHEPILLEVSVENSLAEQIVVDLGANRKEVFAFTIYKPDGSKIEVSPKVPEGSYAIGRVPLLPAQTFSQRLILNQWFDFPQTGKYEIKVRLTKPHITPPGLNIYDLSDVPEFRTFLHVQPRDPERLNQLCTDLQSSIVNAGSKDGSRDAAEALSYVTDSVAVPYLERVLKTSPMLVGFAIDGLERIRDDNAIRVLTEASKSKDKFYTGILAKQALDRIRTGRKRDNLD